MQGSATPEGDSQVKCVLFISGAETLPLNLHLPPPLEHKQRSIINFKERLTKAMTQREEAWLAETPHPPVSHTARAALISSAV